LAHERIADGGGPAPISPPNPQYATAREWYAEFLSWQGRFPEALAESEQARKLDPLSPIIAIDRASILYYSRQYQSSIEECRSALELDPNDLHARIVMLPPYLQLDRYQEAMSEVDLWRAREGDHPWIWAWEAAIYGRWGRAAEARQELRKVEQLNGRFDQSSLLLLAYLGTGENEHALEQLEKAYAARSNAIVQIKLDPIYDPIRNDPRFQDLLRRLRLDQ
jgi:tetratricopeptide (TPR) repeat protein